MQAVFLRGILETLYKHSVVDGNTYFIDTKMGGGI